MEEQYIFSFLGVGGATRWEVGGIGVHNVKFPKNNFFLNYVKKKNTPSFSIF